MGQPSEASFGSVLRHLRVTAGLTQEELAAVSGLSVRGISDLERGQRRVPRLETIRMLADALQLDEAGRSRLIFASRPALKTLAPVPAATTSGFMRRRYTLPHSLTTIVGRRLDVERISAAIRDTDTRLLTLIGPGGVGKTRLALELAEDLTDAFAGGAHFVPLVPLNSPDLVIPAIAEALDVQQTGNVPVFETLCAHLADTEVLLLLDNFEHVLGAASALQELLAGCPQVKVVATSRAPLHVRMERVYGVEPLDLPDPGDATLLEDLQRFDALALFVDRARIADPGFEPASEHVPTIVAICQRLDGLPLAIELAAARLRVVSISELQTMLGSTLPALTGGPRDLPVRHQTLQNTINWSYSLLSGYDRKVFRHMAVFAGGWTLEAARAVAPDGVTGNDIVDSTGNLVSQSLVRRIEVTDGATRYGMLQTIREFGIEHLDRHRESDAVRQRHAQHFLTYMHDLERESSEAEDLEYLNLIAREYDNLRVALRWFISNQDAAGALSLCSDLTQFWTLRGYLGEARAWVNEALAIPDPEPGLSRAQALYTGCLLACHQNDLELAREFALDSLALSRRLDNEAGIVTGLLGLGLAAQLSEEYRLARRAYEDALPLARRISHPKLTPIIGNLAQVHYHIGNVDRSVELLHECIDIDRKVGNLKYTASHVTDLGLILLERGDIEPALDAFSTALRVHHELGNIRMIIYTVEGIAGVDARRGNAARAATLFGAAETLRQQNAYPQQVSNQWGYIDHRTRALHDLGDEHFEQMLAAGRALSLDEGVELALASHNTASLPDL